jgi:diadenosine tetraphosphate (Ap4A) HIT family hydrolase
MAMTPEQFYAHALSAADAERRLPLSRMTYWEVAPFDQDGLRVAPLRPPVVPEPPRQDEDPAQCGACAKTDKGVWHDENWRLDRIDGVGVPLALMLRPREHFDLADLPDDRAAELGVLVTHIARHIEALAHISRAHVYRIGDGGAHLHIWFFARPLGQAQLFGSWLPVWDDLLPEYPAELAQADAEAVARALESSYSHAH